MLKELYTKCIISPQEPIDFWRVSVMSRHTLNDGVTPDARIIEGETFDEWRREFAPPAMLVGAWYRNELTWEEFERQYFAFLQSEEMKSHVATFAQRCMSEIMTLLCSEKTADQCHRRLLAEELRKYQPDLTIIHR